MVVMQEWCAYQVRANYIMMAKLTVSNLTACDNGELRLVGGVSNTEGRVETCLSDEWGTVCDQMWDDTDAAVVCRQLKLASNGVFIL